MTIMETTRDASVLSVQCQCCHAGPGWPCLDMAAHGTYHGERCEPAILARHAVEWVRVGRGTCFRCTKTRVCYTAAFRSDVLCSECRQIINNGCVQQCFPPVHHSECPNKERVDVVPIPERGIAYCPNCAAEISGLMKWREHGAVHCACVEREFWTRDQDAGVMRRLARK